MLPNGKVLLAGGDMYCPEYYGPCAITTTKLYDPKANTWSAGPPLIHPHAMATATLLQNGKVLIVGGVSQGTVSISDAFADAELYDPKTNTWSEAASLPIGRYSHQAFLLHDGRVLVLGGDTFASGGTASACASCANGAASTAGRTLLSDVLPDVNRSPIYCGTGGCPRPATSVEIYNSATNTWPLGASVPDARQYYGASLLPNGDILVAGGLLNGIGTNTVEIYDPTHNTWSAAAPMQMPRAGPSAMPLATGKVLVFGGDSGQVSINAEKSAEVYDPATNSWSTTGDSINPHGLSAAAELADGRILACGFASVFEGIAPKGGASSTAGVPDGGRDTTTPLEAYSTVPGLASNVHAVAGNGSATVTWAPSLSDGSSITSYTVTSQPGSVSKTVKGDATSVTLTGLANGTSYTFTVTANNGIGTGPASAASNSVIPSTTPSPTPTPSNNGIGSGTGSGSGGGPTADAATPTATATGTAGAGDTPVAKVAQPQQQQPTVVSKAAPPPSSSQFPMGLLIGLLILLALLIGGGAAFLVSRSRRSGTM